MANEIEEQQQKLSDEVIHRAENDSRLAGIDHINILPSEIHLNSGRRSVLCLEVASVTVVDARPQMAHFLIDPPLALEVADLLRAQALAQLEMDKEKRNV